MAEIAAIAVSTAFSAAMQQSAAKKQAAQVDAQRRREVQQIQQQQDIAERQKREELRRAQATQRARFSGAGINPESGSASSLIGGLARQVDQAIADNRTMNTLRVEGINADAAAQRSNLLSTPRQTLLNGVNNILTRGIQKSPSLFDAPKSSYPDGYGP